MTLIRINDNVCWRCGRIKHNMTGHHGISQHLKPVHNIEVPICKECHDIINANDLGNMYAYIFKLGRTAEQIRNSAFKLQSELLKYLEKNKEGDDSGRKQGNEMPKV